MLQRQVCVISGGTSGIGYAIANHFARTYPDMSLAILSRNAERAKKKVASLKGDGLRLGFGCNVQDSSDVNNTIKKIENITKSPITICINSAGISEDSLLLRLNDSSLESMVQTNLYGSIYMSRSVLRGMLRQRYGRIINIGSTVGTNGNIGQVAYSSSKAGLIGLTKSLAKEVAQKGITVNMVSPGFIETPMTRKMPTFARANALERIPIGRFGLPEDLTGLIDFLSSSSASYITGQDIHVDGGMH